MRSELGFTSEIRLIILKEYLAIPHPIKVVSKIKAVAEVLSSRSSNFKRRYNIQGEKVLHQLSCEIFLVNKTMYCKYLQVRQRLRGVCWSNQCGLSLESS